MRLRHRIHLVSELILLLLIFLGSKSAESSSCEGILQLFDNSMRSLHDLPGTKKESFNLEGRTIEYTRLPFTPEPVYPLDRYKGSRHNAILDFFNRDRSGVWVQISDQGDTRIFTSGTLIEGGWMHKLPEVSDEYTILKPGLLFHLKGAGLVEELKEVLARELAEGLRSISCSRAVCEILEKKMDIKMKGGPSRNVYPDQFAKRLILSELTDKNGVKIEKELFFMDSSGLAKPSYYFEIWAKSWYRTAQSEVDKRIKKEMKPRFGPKLADRIPRDPVMWWNALARPDLKSAARNPELFMDSIEVTRINQAIGLRKRITKSLSLIGASPAGIERFAAFENIQALEKFEKLMEKFQPKMGTPRKVQFEAFLKNHFKQKKMDVDFMSVIACVY